MHVEHQTIALNLRIYMDKLWCYCLPSLSSFGHFVVGGIQDLAALGSYQIPELLQFVSFLVKRDHPRTWEVGAAREHISVLNTDFSDGRNTWIEEKFHEGILFNN